MSKLRVLVVGLLVMAVLTIGLPLAASAFSVPALVRATVYVDDELAGAGVTVGAIIGDESTPRAGNTGVTKEDGVAILMLEALTEGDVTDPATALSFTVDGAAADESPDVDVTMAYQEVDLYATAGARVEVWDMPFGLDQDLGAVNFYSYPADAVQVTLDDIADTAPPELSIVWHYSGPGEGWHWFVPLVDESTLQTLDPGEIYVGVATSATSWEIPQ